MGKLEGKVAVITGSDSGIGRATAIAFAREGADVAVDYLEDQAGAEETKRQVEEAGQRAVVVQSDVRDPEQVAHFFERAQELGTPYVLTNNAGASADGPVAELPLEDWDKVLKTNLYGPFYCCQHFIRLRKAAGGGGIIINLTSVHQELPTLGGAAYDASKGGLRNLTRVLALELAPHKINVNNLAPGMVLTPFNQEALEDEETRRESTQNIPWKRAAEPWEVAALALYLASEDANFVTGQTFTIDGGQSVNVGQGV